jgi:hypothetical protein
MSAVSFQTSHELIDPPFLFAETKEMKTKTKQNKQPKREKSKRKKDNNKKNHTKTNKGKREKKAKNIFRRQESANTQTSTRKAEQTKQNGISELNTWPTTEHCDEHPSVKRR